MEEMSNKDKVKTSSKSKFNDITASLKDKILKSKTKQIVYEDINYSSLLSDKTDKTNKSFEEKRSSTNIINRNGNDNDRLKMIKSLKESLHIGNSNQINPYSKSAYELNVYEESKTESLYGNSLDHLTYDNQRKQVNDNTALINTHTKPKVKEDKHFQDLKDNLFNYIFNKPTVDNSTNIKPITLKNTKVMSDINKIFTPNENIYQSNNRLNNKIQGDKIKNIYHDMKAGNIRKVNKDMFL